MIAIDQDDWMDITKKKSLRNSQNKELVTARANIINGRKAIKISIGLVVADLLEWKKTDKVTLHIHKKNRDLIMIKKSVTNPHDGYKLSCGGANSNFLTFEFRSQSSDEYRLSQTILLDYDISSEKYLVININKLKWKG